MQYAYWKQLKIFEVFTRKPYESLQRKQVKELSKENSNNAITLAIKKFKQELLITENKVGNLLYTI